MESKEYMEKRLKREMIMRILRQFQKNPGKIFVASEFGGAPYRYLDFLKENELIEEIETYYVIIKSNTRKKIKGYRIIQRGKELEEIETEIENNIKEKYQINENGF